MNKYKIWILLLAIWNVILFYGNSWGISVLLFIIPLLVYLYFLMKDNKLINNKKGLLLMIPIILLSLTYFIFNNEGFKIFNFIVIIGLIALMYAITIKNTFKFLKLVENFFSSLFEPIVYLDKFFYSIFPKKEKRINKLKLSDKTKRILISILIALPVIIIVLALLSSADMIFGKIFDKFFSLFTFNINFKIDSLGDIIGRIIRFFIVFCLLGSSMVYLKEKYYLNDKEEIIKEEKNKDLLSLKILFISLNIIYIIFDFIQIKSLMLHSISMSGITYAEYARQGFFQLMVVSLINLSIILISKRFENKNNKKEFNLIKIMSVIMLLLTIVIVVSSFLRMNLYEQAYGYTTLRLLVYIALITEFILMIPTLLYIFNSKYNIVKSYMIIIIIVYVLTNYMNIDYMIARRNIDRYYETKKIDLNYLRNYGTDNVKLLIELYNNLNTSDEKRELNDYLYDIGKDNKTDNIFEYNLSKDIAVKEIKKVKLDKPEFYR